MSPNLIRQLIYTRVEEAFSPKRKSGYQVFYVSSDIEQADIDSIVAKVRVFEPNRSSVKRWQCFRLRSRGDAVICKTTVIDSDPKIIDRDQRPDILVAHCLILDPASYQAFGNNPFSFFEGFSFISSSNELIERYNQSESREFPASLPSPSASLCEIDQGWVKDVLNLALIATPGFVNTRKSVLLYGEDQEIYRTLRSIYACVPPSYRKNLSFDTYIAGNQKIEGEYWAVGLNQWKTGYDITINTSSKSFSNTPDYFADTYISWAQMNLQNALDPQVLMSAQELSDAFLLNSPTNTMNISDRALNTFYEANENLIRSRVIESLRSLMDQELLSYFAPFYFKQSSIRAIINNAANKHISRTQLGFSIRQWLIASSGELERFRERHWAEIKAFSIGARDDVLAMWSAASTKDKKLFREVASRISPEDYEIVLELLERPLSPKSLLIPKYYRQFINAMLRNQERLTERDFVDVVQMMVRNNGNELLGGLDVFVRTLGNKELTRLEKITKGARISAGVKSAIRERRATLGPPYTLVDEIFKDL